jgi:hypothetical protein
MWRLYDKKPSIDELHPIDEAGKKKALKQLRRQTPGFVRCLSCFQNVGSKPISRPLISTSAPSITLPGSFDMTLRKIMMSAPKDRYFPSLLDAHPSKFCYINPKQKFAMPVQERANVLAARVGD